MLGNPGGEVRASLNPGRSCSPPGESGWYDYAAKYTPGGMQLMVPARISAAAREARPRAGRRRCSNSAGCAGLARADFFVNGEEVLVNELNTMPGFTETSVYGALWNSHRCCPYPELLDQLVQLAIERHARAAAHSG